MTYHDLYRNLQTLSGNLKTAHTYANLELLGLQLLFYPTSTTENSNQLHHSVLDLSLNSMSIEFTSFHLLRVNLAHQKCTFGYLWYKQNEHIFSKGVAQSDPRVNLFLKKVSLKLSIMHPWILGLLLLIFSQIQVGVVRVLVKFSKAVPPSHSS